MATEMFLQAGLLILSMVTILWLISVIITNASIVDLFWGFGFVVVNAFYFILSDEFHLRQIILLVLVSLWGLRLTTYLSIRNIGKGEDFRYQDFRNNYGPRRYWWISYFQTFLLQGVLMWIISLPYLGVHTHTSSDSLTILDFLAIIVWLVGFVFEAGGDFQLSKFKKDPANKGKLMRSGFWKYTRHPNYFGDSAVWWGFGLFSIASGALWHAAGALLMTIIIIKVSGVSLLEKSMKTTKPGYEEYVRTTSSFFPWFPKKLAND